MTPIFPPPSFCLHQSSSPNIKLMDLYWFLRLHNKLSQFLKIYFTTISIGQQSAHSSAVRSPKTEYRRSWLYSHPDSGLGKDPLLRYACFWQNPFPCSCRIYSSCFFKLSKKEGVSVASNLSLLDLLEGTYSVTLGPPKMFTF